MAPPSGQPSRPPPRDPAQIRAEIERARDEVADALILLRDELQARLDWRWTVRRRPGAAVAAAFFAGVWLGWR
jgi:hypothetical protein